MRDGGDPLRPPDAPSRLSRRPAGRLCLRRAHGNRPPGGAQPRERWKRNEAQRRANWLKRAWRVSQRGNEYLNVDNFNVTVFQRPDQHWGGRILHKPTGTKRASQLPYRSKNEAKLAAFDKLQEMKVKLERRER
ncbi:MAG: hypothetical protein U5L06_08695 [Rhodovibrio sp.]|nr:hypothetical protein [Rhodovibrio sp.]